MGQNLGQIRPNVVKKVKKWALSIVFFHTLHREYLLKQIIVVVQTSEWKSKKNIAGNSTFEGRWGQLFAPFGSKMAKNCLFSRISL